MYPNMFLLQQVSLFLVWTYISKRTEGGTSVLSPDPGAEASQSVCRPSSLGLPETHGVRGIFLNLGSHR